MGLIPSGTIQVSEFLHHLSCRNYQNLTNFLFPDPTFLAYTSPHHICLSFMCPSVKISLYPVLCDLANTMQICLSKRCLSWRKRIPRWAVERQFTRQRSTDVERRPNLFWSKSGNVRPFAAFTSPGDVRHRGRMFGQPFSQPRGPISKRLPGGIPSTRSTRCASVR